MAGDRRFKVGVNLDGKLFGKEPAARLDRPFLWIQSADGKTWATVAHATVDANGDFDAQLQLSPGAYRAVVAAFSGYAPGTTPVLNVVGD